jgi:hypothetical protein
VKVAYSGLKTRAPNSKVVVNLGGKGGRGCNVYRQVGSSATVGKGSIFVGNVLALTRVTLNGSVFRGKALARNAAISVSAQETVDGPRCVALASRMVTIWPPLRTKAIDYRLGVCRS